MVSAFNFNTDSVLATHTLKNECGLRPDYNESQSGASTDRPEYSNAGSRTGQGAIGRLESGPNESDLTAFE